jgi:hypothetical protein
MEPERICTMIQELCRKHHVYGNSLLGVYLFERFYGLNGLTKGYLNIHEHQKSIEWYYYIIDGVVYSPVVFHGNLFVNENEYTITKENSYETQMNSPEIEQFYNMLLSNNIEPYWYMCNERSYKLFEELMTLNNLLGQFVVRRKKQLNSSEPCACGSGVSYGKCHKNLLF